MITWLNGKKSIIALILFILCSVFVLITGQHIEGFAGVDNWTGIFTLVLFSGSTIMGALGLSHKWVKVQSAIDKGREFAERNPELITALYGIVNSYLKKQETKEIEVKND